MKASADVYAAGDVAQFPLPLIGHTTNIGHWQVAHKHGMGSHAVLAMDGLHVLSCDLHVMSCDLHVPACCHVTCV